MTHEYGVRDVEKFLGLPRSTIRALVDAGFVTPARGARNAWLFSFQDLIVLRTAQALAHARMPHRRITRSLKELRRHLPETMPLSGLRIGAVADRVVVSEGGKHWQAESGQYLLAFDGDPNAGELKVIEQRAPAPEADDDWFDQAVSLEGKDNVAAVRAYERAIADDPAHLEARINLGLLLHQNGELARAVRVYSEALDACGADAILLFNFGVLFDDMRRKPDAVKAYLAALRADPSLADAHYNLALLYKQLGKPKDAIRHMSQYRRLVAK
jgi:tetratricopeptide (TPR) repeat protein